jgi:hypothetical protein
MFGRELEQAFIGMIAFIALVAAALGGLVVWGVPILWSWLKPWIHVVTG